MTWLHLSIEIALAAALAWVVFKPRPAPAPQAPEPPPPSPSSGIDLKIDDLYEAAPYGIALIEPDKRRIVDTNPAMAALSGRPREALVGASVEALSLDGGLLKRLLSPGGSQAPEHEEIELIRPDGERVPIEILGAAAAKRGHVQVAMRDITERRRDQERLQRSHQELAALMDVRNTDLALTQTALRDSEARYRSLIKLSPVALLVVDDEVLFVNQAAVEMFAAADADELIGLPLDRLLPHRTVEVTRDGFQVLDDEDRALPTVEAELLRLDGSRFDAEISTARYPMGDRTAVLAAIRDVTERKRLDKLKDEFISTVNHELRTPLTSIKGSLGLAVGGVLGPMSADMEEAIGIAHRNCDRLIRLINDLLDVQKIASGRMVYRIAPVALCEVLKRAVGENSPMASERGLTLDLACPPQDLLVLADPDRLNQVVTNLLSNAIKFSPAGSPVSIDVRVDGPHAWICVTDRGPGIPEAFQARIFDKFSQADASNTRDKSGTGLGLNISRAIVEAHKGAITFDTRPGRGTTFRFSIPRHVGKP